MAKRPTHAEWIRRFKHVARNATDDGIWRYTRLELSEAVAAFNSLGLRWHRLEAKAATTKEQVGRGVKTKVIPGCYFKVVEKE